MEVQFGEDNRVSNLENILQNLVSFKNVDPLVMEVFTDYITTDRLTEVYNDEFAGEVDKQICNLSYADRVICARNTIRYHEYGNEKILKFYYLKDDEKNGKTFKDFAFDIAKLDADIFNKKIDIKPDYKSNDYSFSIMGDYNERALFQSLLLEKTSEIDNKFIHEK
ncbi:MAG: hypothetical protein WC393_04770 [Candidatus Nanoarchaeia archaeon]|jgi:hypothetical protein